MKQIAVIFLFVLFLSGYTAAQKQKFIIDTDAATDDLRAIGMMLSINEFDIKAITLCEGTLSPEQGLRKINAMMSYLQRPDIEFASGRSIKTVNPPWRNTAAEISWGGKDKDTIIKQNAVQLIRKITEQESGTVTIVCLGSLTNIADLIADKQYNKKAIKRIVWYNEGLKNLSGFNYEVDKKSADAVLNSGIPVTVISNLKKESAKYDDAFVNEISKSNNKIIKPVVSAINQLTRQSHEAIWWDDLVPVYLLRPQLFEVTENAFKPEQSYVTDYLVKYVRKLIIEIYQQNYSAEHNIIFERFPKKSSEYQFDVEESVDEIIKRHGAEEWKLCVLTNEIHGHLGVYSILGAKMGLKAREIFKAPLDRIEVVSFAGSRPPLSCLNDGLQISTGATLGLGMISIAPDSVKSAQAIFKYNNKSIRIKLKMPYYEMVEKDIKEGILKYGNLSQGYWKLVRVQAVKYWLEWDRNQIFDIEYL